MNRTVSLYLDVLRICAALMVFVRHLSYPEITGGLLRLPNTGHLGVVVFFVLSGYVIAWLVDERETDWRDYAAARVSRLVSVAGPPILLMLPAWLMGVVAYRGQKRSALSRPMAAVAFLGTLAVLVTVVGLDWISAIPKARFLGQAKTFWFDWVFAGLVALNIVAATRIVTDAPDWLAARTAGVRSVANATFPLYLCHFPLLLCVRAVFPDVATGYAGVLVQVAILGGVVVAMTYLSDGLKHRMRSAFHRLVPGSPGQLRYNPRP